MCNRKKKEKKNGERKNEKIKNKIKKKRTVLELGLLLVTTEIIVVGFGHSGCTRRGSTAWMSVVSQRDVVSEWGAQRGEKSRL